MTLLANCYRHVHLNTEFHEKIHNWPDLTFSKHNYPPLTDVGQRRGDLFDPEFPLLKTS